VLPGIFNGCCTRTKIRAVYRAAKALRELDRVGPVNYKGLFTPWGQPTDAFYMYRANYAPKDKEPMVYIVSHTWPNRWLDTR
jgi:hypothetical protein